MDNREIRQIGGYAEHLKELLNGEELPPFEAGVPLDVIGDAQRQAGGRWLRRANQILEQDWHAVRRILEKDKPEKMQTLKELRQDALNTMGQEPRGGARHLEPRDGKLVPDAILKPKIVAFADELRYEADEAPKTARVLKRTIGIIVAIVMVLAALLACLDFLLKWSEPIKASFYRILSGG
jgi:hypothetical protein